MKILNLTWNTHGSQPFLEQILLKIIEETGKEADILIISLQECYNVSIFPSGLIIRRCETGANTRKDNIIEEDGNKISYKYIREYSMFGLKTVVASRTPLSIHFYCIGQGPLGFVNKGFIATVIQDPLDIENKASMEHSTIFHANCHLAAHKHNFKRRIEQLDEIIANFIEWLGSGRSYRENDSHPNDYEEEIKQTNGGKVAEQGNANRTIKRENIKIVRGLDKFNKTKKLENISGESSGKLPGLRNTFSLPSGWPSLFWILDLLYAAPIASLLYFPILFSILTVFFLFSLCIPLHKHHRKTGAAFILSGDLNFRSPREPAALLEKYPWLAEEKISFEPTYKYKGDILDNGRIPAHCDRIMYWINDEISKSVIKVEVSKNGRIEKKQDAKILLYTSIDSVTCSDHKPVVCIIEANRFGSSEFHDFRINKISSGRSLRIARTRFYLLLIKKRAILAIVAIFMLLESKRTIRSTVEFRSILNRVI